MVKAVMAGFLLLALGVMWTYRVPVLDAYRSDEATATVRLSGVDLDIESSEIEPTPYRIPSAPDTRSASQLAAFEPDLVLPPPAPSFTGGEAELRGTVTGPEGPVPEAVVRIERHTSHGAISVDTSTDENGQWALASLAGGRYRVRAWLPDQLSMGRSEVRFVADDEIASFDFSLWGVDPAPVFEFVDGGPMYEGVPAPAALVLVWRSIDADGLVATNPLPGAEVTVETTAQVQVLGGPDFRTGFDGVARLQLRCVPTSIAPLAPNPSEEVTADGSADQAPGAGRITGAGQAPGAGQITGVGLVGAAQDPSTAGPGGVLTARSGETTATFTLPGCRPVPEPQPEPGPDSSSGPSTGGEPVDAGEQSDA